MYGVFQEQTYSKGIDVYTTIDSKAQEAAYRAVRDGVLDYTRRSVYPGPEDQIDLPDGVEKDAQALDDILDGVRKRRRTARTCWPPWCWPPVRRK